MWPHGEEWVHEAIAETYVPLLEALYDLRDEGVDYRLTISVTPILAEQLDDALIKEHFLTYAEERSAWAAADITRFNDAGEPEMKALAIHFHHWYARVLTSFRDRFGCDIIGALRDLQNSGHVEISTSAATHGYLPLLSRDSSIAGQLTTGVASYERMFGRRPKAIWLPECAYRPAYWDEQDGDQVRRPGIESFLAEQGINVFFAETHSVEGGQPVGKAAGEAIGIYGEVSRRYTLELTPSEQVEPGTTYKAYWVGDAAGKVAVLGRNSRTGQQVWSGDFGYPGDLWYREFHRKDAVSGMQYWRIGGPGLDLGDKPQYDPVQAANRVKEHAAHFVNLVEDLLEGYASSTGTYGIIASNYDTELFGHWWFEGVDWIREVLRGLATSSSVDLTTASTFVREHQPDRVMAVPESSWGSGGNHFTWLNKDTEWMWPIIHEAESRMEQLVGAHPDAEGVQLEVLSQTARELLLLQSSDWPFLVTTGQAREYASQRFTEHADRFASLAQLAERGGQLTNEESEMLAALTFQDNPFPEIDYRAFANRQGRTPVTANT
jgi:1,4-alpha-glucan branching enzyme